LNVSRRRKKYSEKERNLTYKEEDRDNEEDIVGICNRRDPGEVK